VSGSQVATTPIDQAVVIDVLANDLNSEGGPIALDRISSTANGTVSRDDNGTPDDRTDDLLVYTPNSGFNGIDSFSYGIADGQGNTDTGTVTVGVLSLDIDNNGTIEAGTDGLLAIKYLFGYVEDTLIEGAIGANAARTNPDDIIAYLDLARDTMLDADGNGMADAITDGILISLSLSGVTNENLISSFLGEGTTSAQIGEFLQPFRS